MFTNPTALFALGLLALPVVIHLLSRASGPRVKFASVMFLPRSTASRFRLLKLHRWPLLILRLLTCGLLVLAIAGPVFVNRDKEPRSALILLDASLSMNSETIKESVIEQARKQVAAMTEKDLIAVAVFDYSVSLLCDFTSDRSLVERAIASYAPGYTEADFGGALSWASERLAAQPARHLLILISDLQATNVAGLDPVELSGDLRVIRIERPQGVNLSPGDVAVRSFGGRYDIATALMLSEDGRVEVRPISLGPGPLSAGPEATVSNSSASLSIRLLAGGVIAGRLTSGVADSFGADDSRFFVARLPVEAPVLIVQPLVTAANHAEYVEKALQASLYQVSDVSPARVIARLPGDADALGQYRAVICPARSIDKNAIPALREYARRGGLVVVTLGVEDGGLPEGLIEGASTSPVDQLQTAGLLPPLGAGGDGPIDEQGLFASYGAVRFGAARRIIASEGEVALRYSGGESAAVRIATGRGSLVLLGFGLSGKDTSLVLSPLFPQFIEWLAGGAAPSVVSRHTAGRAPRSSLLGSARKLTRVYSFNGPARDEEVAPVARTLDEPGIYRVEREKGDLLFAINTPAPESRLAQSSEQALIDRITMKSGGAIEPSPGQSIALWWITASAAFLLSLVELVYCSIELRAREN
jgi:hypothetical protein